MSALQLSLDPTEALRVSRDRLVVLDYHFAPGRLGRLAASAISSYETAYLPRFAEEGVRPLLAELGMEPSLERRLFPGCFAVWVVRQPVAGEATETGDRPS